MITSDMIGGLFDWLRGSASGAPAPLEETRSAKGPRSEGAPAAEIRSDPQQRFEYRSELGRGGSGVVLRVFDRNLAREVAMKVLDMQPPGESFERSAFIAEAQMTGRLDHPNIVPVHDLGLDGHGRTYFVMRMVEGRTLHERRRRPDPERSFEERLQELLLVLLKVCDAVAFAHSRGLVHCDLKPQNVMVGSFGEVYVVDWGLARLRPGAGGGSASPVPEGPGEIVGTPAYLSPEAAWGDAALLDERTDVFGLGALLYFVLTGRPPYPERTVEAAIERARECRFDDPQEIAGGILPPALCEVARKALARSPARRYASAVEMKAALEAYLRGGLGASVRTFAPGETIVAEGEPGDTAYLITRGRCRATKTVDSRMTVLREMGPGDVFGEIAVILASPRTATVEAIDEVTTQVVSRTQLEKSLEFHPWLARIVRQLTERFRDMDARRTP